MNGGPTVSAAASQNIFQQYQGLLNTLAQQQQQPQAQQGTVPGVFSTQAQVQQAPGGMGPAPLLQLFSSLMAGAPNTSSLNTTPTGNAPGRNNNNNNGLPDLMQLAQQMGLLPQQPPQQSQQAVPASSSNMLQAQASASGNFTTKTAVSQKLPAKQTLKIDAAAAAAPKAQPSFPVCLPVGQQPPPAKKAKKSPLAAAAPVRSNAPATHIPCRARGMDMNHNFEVSL